MSRVEAIEKPFDHQALEAAQKEDHELREILDSDASVLKLKKVRFPDHGIEIYCDTANDVVRPYVSKPLRRKIFNALHGLSHPRMRGYAKSGYRAFCLASN